MKFSSCEFSERKICTVGTLWTRKPQLAEQGEKEGLRALGRLSKAPPKGEGTRGTVPEAGPRLHGPRGWWRMRMPLSFFCIGFFERTGYMFVSDFHKSPPLFAVVTLTLSKESCHFYAVFNGEKSFHLKSKLKGPPGARTK